MRLNYLCLACGSFLAAAVPAPAASAPAGPAAGWVTAAEFRCDNSPRERFWLAADRESFLDLSLLREPFRISDMQHEFTYRFDLAGAGRARVALDIANSYHVQASADGTHFTTVLRTPHTIENLRNKAVLTVDLTPFLKPSGVIWLKFADALPADGYGGCLFGLRLEVDRLAPPAPTLTARRVSAPVTVDGNPNEADWSTAAWAANFTLYGRALPVTQETRAAFLYDDQNLYVAFDCLDARMDQVVSLVKQRDADLYRDNAVELFLAATPERRDYRHFGVNTLGTILDETVDCRGPEAKFDLAWNPQWRVAVRRLGDRWQAELAIPWTALEVQPQPGVVLGLNLTRMEGPSQELSTWVPFLDGGFHQPARFGRLLLAGPEAATSFVLDVRSLLKNPPVFLPFSEQGPAAKAWCARIRYWPSAAAAGAVPVFEGWAMASRVPATGLALAETPLPSGRYTVVVDWQAEGVPVYRQAVGVTLVAEDRRALVVTPDQPFYAGEKEVGFRYRCRPAAAGRYRWRVEADPALAVKSAASAPVLAEGVLTLAAGEAHVALPMPVTAVGRYQFKLLPIAGGASAAAVAFAFEIGTPLGVPTRYTLGRAGEWYRNGRPFTPVGIHLPQDMKAVAAAGFNIVVAGDDDVANPQCLQNNLALLEAARKEGLGVFLHLCNPLRGKEDYAAISWLVSRFKTHPALAGWYLADEPSGTATTVATLAEAVRVIRLIDREHPVIGLDNNPMLFAAYAPLFDVFGGDPYPVPHNPLGVVTEWVELSRRPLAQGQSLFVCLQAQGQPFFPRGPNRDELWNMAYQSVAAGVKGMSWWAYGTAAASPEWPEYPKLTRAMAELLGHAAFAVREPLAGLPPGVFASAFERQGKRLLVAVNSTPGPVALTLPAGLEPAAVAAPLHGVTAAGGKLQFAPLGGGAWWLK